MLLVLAVAALATNPVRGEVIPPRTEVLRSDGDSFPIHITYYQVAKDANPENAPVVVMLHGEGGNRLIWDKSSAPKGGSAFAENLAKSGYAVVTVDLRKHGESVRDGDVSTVDANDYYKMVVGDLVAVKRFLVQEHEQRRLNIGKLGFIASDKMCAVALAFAEGDWRQPPYLDGPGGTAGTPRGQDVKALVLISPDPNVGRVNGTRSVQFLRSPLFGISFFIAAGTQDAANKNAAERINDMVSGIKANKDRVEFYRPNTNARGTDLLNNSASRVGNKILETAMLDFLKKHLYERGVPWQTRVSRYDRETPAP